MRVCHTAATRTSSLRQSHHVTSERMDIMKLMMAMMRKLVIVSQIRCLIRHYLQFLQQLPHLH